MKIKNIYDLMDQVDPEEWVIVDVLRQLVLDNLPAYVKEKISYNVPYFYGHKGICIIWPSSIPRGGIKEGVLFGFWRGNELEDVDQYLTKGTNKKIFYKIYKRIEEIDVKALEKLLEQAIKLDLIE